MHKNRVRITFRRPPERIRGSWCVCKHAGVRCAHAERAAQKVFAIGVWLLFASMFLIESGTHVPKRTWLSSEAAKCRPRHTYVFFSRGRAAHLHTYPSSRIVGRTHFVFETLFKPHFWNLYLIELGLFGVHTFFILFHTFNYFPEPP